MLDVIQKNNLVLYADDCGLEQEKIAQLRRENLLIV